MDTDAKAGNRKGRPNYPTDFKRRLATEACAPGVSVSKLALQHAINVNMLFKWRRELRAGLFGSTTSALVPVLIKDADERATPPPLAAPLGGVIEIVIGDATVRVHANANATLLKLVLASLRP